MKLQQALLLTLLSISCHTTTQGAWFNPARLASLKKILKVSLLVAAPSVSAYWLQKNAFVKPLCGCHARTSRVVRKQTGKYGCF